MEVDENLVSRGTKLWLTDDSNHLHWTATIKGAEDTPYEDGLFYLALEAPVNYPFRPPRVRFVTPIFHPAVDTEGNLCLDILR